MDTTSLGDKRPRDLSPNDTDEHVEKKPKILHEELVSTQDVSAVGSPQFDTTQQLSSSAIDTDTEIDESDLATFAESIKDIPAESIYSSEPISSHQQIQETEASPEIIEKLPSPPKMFNNQENMSSSAQQVVDSSYNIPTHTPRRRKPKSLEDEYDYDPDSKWNKIATSKLVDLFHSFGRRRVVDGKFQSTVRDCLSKGANPAVPLPGPDGVSFFTFLSVAAERGEFGLVKLFLTEHGSEFSAFDKKHALQGALRNREQEIAEYLIQNDAPVDRETLVCMFDINMNDESELKILPLKAILERIDQGRFDPSELFLPELLNRAIYANNVAALEFLFEQKPDQVRPLLFEATPVVNQNIRPGRGKAQDIGEGVPPLTFAAMMERIECLEVFLRNGADPNFSCEEMGGTLLHIAGFKNNLELIELLIDFNADPRIPNSRGVTVLSRTKGRKARKKIRDAAAKLDKNEGDDFVTTNDFMHHSFAHQHPHPHQHLHQHISNSIYDAIPPPGALQPPLMIPEISLPPNFTQHGFPHSHFPQ